MQALTDRLLRSWLRCRRRAWLDRHGDPSLRRWTAHRALQLQDQLRSFQTLLPTRPGHGEVACGAAAEGVVGLRLADTLAGGLRVEAHPPLLLRQEGTSRWGNHRYQPVLARLGRRLTRDQRLQLTLWGRLLETSQQAPVPTALVVAGAGSSLERETLALAPSLQSQLQESLLRLQADLERSDPPDLVNDRKKCVLCSWRGLCDQEATAIGHLSEVSGVGGKRRDLLLGLGLATVADLAAADPEGLADQLETHGEQHREAALALVAQARVQVSGIPVRLRVGPVLPELERAPGVLLYDIESDPDARDDFLHGFVLLQRSIDGSWPEAAAARYLPLLARYEHGEARLWRRLSALLQRYPDWPLLHYGETEVLTLVRMAQRQGASQAEQARLRARCLDVHQRLRQHWLLPVNSYGLKAVAQGIGFRWSQTGVDGARALLWWRQWRLGDPSRTSPARHDSLRRIFRYNRDDNLATWAVVSWLLGSGASGPPLSRLAQPPPAEP
jgi:predicted RecB family nuclease